MQPGRELSELPQYPAVPSGARISLRGSAAVWGHWLISGEPTIGTAGPLPARLCKLFPSTPLPGKVIASNCVIAD